MAILAVRIPTNGTAGCQNPHHWHCRLSESPPLALQAVRIPITGTADCQNTTTGTAGCQNPHHSHCWLSESPPLALQAVRIPITGTTGSQNHLDPYQLSLHNLVVIIILLGQWECELSKVSECFVSESTGVGSSHGHHDDYCKQTNNQYFIDTTIQALGCTILAHVYIQTPDTEWEQHLKNNTTYYLYFVINPYFQNMLFHEVHPGNYCISNDIKLMIDYNQLYN